jgi:hypothetical protein
MHGYTPADRLLEDMAGSDYPEKQPKGGSVDIAVDDPWPPGFLKGRR